MTSPVTRFLVISLAAHALAVAAWHAPDREVLVSDAGALRVAVVSAEARAPSAEPLASAPPEATVPRRPAPAPIATAAPPRTPHAPSKSPVDRTAPAPNPPVAAQPAVDASDTASARYATAAPQPPQLSAAPRDGQLQERVRMELDRYFSYPPLARRKGWEGLVKLRLRVEHDGQLSQVHLEQSSGYAALDAAALASARRIPPLSEAADWLRGDHFDMVLPVEYRLVDG